MSKTKDMARNFMKRATQEQSFKESFEVISPAKSQTIGIAITVNLTSQEENQIQKILVDDYRPGTISEESVQEHIQKLTDLTRQIKSISAQSVLLHGERIKQAQEILKDYREGAFTKWLMATYGNRQTPYSMLRYYELYQEAPISHKALIESAPKKAIYLLASRDGDFNKKLELIKQHGSSPQSNLVQLIQETFPVPESDQRKPLNAATIDSISKACEKLEKRKQYLTQKDMQELSNIIQKLQELCD
jgi:hypothetical protein